jgi:hypothetical protein
MNESGVADIPLEVIEPYIDQIECLAEAGLPISGDAKRLLTLINQEDSDQS